MIDPTRKFRASVRKSFAPGHSYRKAKKRSPGHKQQRSLQYESLEQRHLLSSVPVLVSDLNSLTNTSSAQLSQSVTIHDSVANSDITYFAADDGVHGRELWRTDGTAAGTKMVKDINNVINDGSSDPFAAGRPHSSSPQQLVNVNGTLYFRASNAENQVALFQSDGTAAGTLEVAGFPTSIEPPTITRLTAVGDKLFFQARETGSTEIRLWVTDSAGTRNMTDLNSQAGVMDPRFDLSSVNGKLVFWADNGSGGLEMWTSDGTMANTKQVTDLNPSGTFVSRNFPEQRLIQDAGAGDRLYFTGRKDGEAYSLWITDGTLAGTEPLAATIATKMANVGGKLYFQAAESGYGHELWSSDGTPGGTSRITDIAPGTESSLPQQIVGLGSTAYFKARAGNSEPLTFWKTDGTTVEPVSLPDGAHDLTAAGTHLFFVAQDPTIGKELFAFNADGSVSSFDLNPGDASSGPRHLVEVNGRLMFTATSGTQGGAIWVSDGELATTSVIMDINQTTRGSGVSSLVELNGNAYFANWGIDQELYVTDGTPAGTQRVTNLRPGVAGARILNVTRVGDALFFTGFDSTGLRKLWKFDGTNTELVTDEVEPSGLHEFEGRLYFSGRSRTVIGKVDLWVSDGTTGGTHKLSFNAKQGTFPRFVGDIGGELFFSADDGSGTSLWRSDGDFGRGGRIESSVLVQSDGKLVAVGQAGTSMMVMRFNPDGTIDTSFGENGRVLNKDLDRVIGKAALQSDGKILIGTRVEVEGATGHARYEIAVVRLMSDGSYDPTFGTDGVSVIDLPGLNDGVTSLGLQDVGGEERIVLSTDPIEMQGNFDIAVVRLQTDGSLDTTFGEDADSDGTGVVTVPNTGVQFESAVVLADGSVVAAGDSVHLGTGSTVVVKLDANGNLDSAFGNSGFFSTHFGEQRGQAWTLSLQDHPTTNQPHLVVAGSAYNGTDNRWAMARMDLAGTIDTTFSDDGHTTVGVGLRKFSSDLTGTGVTSQSHPVASGGHLYFTADHPSLGRQLWALVNGNEPVALTDFVAPSPGFTAVSDLVDFNGTLYFNVTKFDGNTGIHTSELWRSNASVDTTERVAVIEDGERSAVHQTAVVGGNLYFTVARHVFNSSQLNVSELWVTDGTTTAMVDSAPAPAIDSRLDFGFDLLTGLRASNGKVFYQKLEQSTGFELWSHDGSTSTLVADLVKGVGNSHPSVFDVAGETYVQAKTPRLGSELFRLLDDTDPATTPALTISDGVSGTVEVARVGDDLVVTKGGVELSRSALGTIVGLSIQGAAESEVFAVNIDGLSSAILPHGITIAAGEGVDDNDSLILSGSTTVSNYDYTTGGPESGTIVLDDFEVTFSEFEPIIDQLNVVNRSFNVGTAGSQQIVLEADSTSGTLLSDGGTGAFESVLFKVPPSNTLAISAGDGDDSITIGQLDSAFGAVLSVDGGDGNDSIDASQTTNSVGLIGGSGDDTLLGGSAVRHLRLG